MSGPVKSGSGWHLVKAEEVVPAKRISLDDARETIARELLVRERALALAKERASAALAQAKAGKPLSATRVGAQTVAPEETGLFARGTPFVPKLGEAPGLLADAFAAKAGQALPGVYETPAGPVVATVKRRESADPKAFDAEREAFATRLRGRKESHVEGAWLRSLREGAKIETNATLLAGASAQAQ